MQVIKKKELSEVRSKVSMEQLEQYITDLEISLIEKDIEIVDIKEQLEQLKEAKEA